MENLSGKVALITGGSKGIGYGIAASLLQQGMHVAITSRDYKAAAKAAEQLEKKGSGSVLPLEADVRSYQAQEKSVEEVLNKWGRLDVLVANAGVGYFASIEDMSPEQWNEVIDINLTGVFYSVKAALPALAETKGYIITISSLAGTNFFAKGSAYNASKFGLVGLSQAIMLDLRNKDIKVTTIMPGSVTSHFNEHTPNPADAWKIQPEDIGQMVVSLLEMHPRTLPSKIEVRPTKPGK